MRAWLLAAILAAAGLAGCLGDDGWTQGARDMSDPEAYLLGSPYPDLIVEIDHVEGREPSPAAIDHLLTVLREATDKRSVELLGPTRIEVEDTSEDVAWNATERWDLHARTYSIPDPHAKGSGQAAVIHVLYVNGGIGDEGKGREVADGHVAFVAPDHIDGGSDVWIRGERVVLDPPPAEASERLYREKLETYLLVHGVGHVLGLVNAPLPMLEDRLPDEDRDPCQCHSTSRDSVMGVQHKDWINGVADQGPSTEEDEDLDAVPTTFDDHDIEDIRAFQRAHGEGAR